MSGDSHNERERGVRAPDRKLISKSHPVNKAHRELGQSKPARMRSITLTLASISPSIG